MLIWGDFWNIPSPWRSLAEKIAGHYSGIDRDMLIAPGPSCMTSEKTRELEYDVKIDYSDERAIFEPCGHRRAHAA